MKQKNSIIKSEKGNMKGGDFVKEIDIVVWKEEKQYVSQCVNIDVASCGDSMEEAIANLKEAVELRLEGENVELPKIERITIGKEQINA